jgi:hypothetical protein
MSLDITSNVIFLDPPSLPDSPSIKLEYKGYKLDLGAASDRLLACFILELTDQLGEMIARNNKHGWAGGQAAFEYAKSQIHYHLRGLMNERARRMAIALSTMPVPVGAA